MKKKTEQNNRLMIGAGAAGVLLLFLLAVLWMTSNSKGVSSVTRAGITYLEALEQKDAGQVDEVLKERRVAQMKAESESRKQALLDGTVDVWSLFGDTVIMGDSRAVGFYVFEFLPQSRVLAEGGNTIRDIEQHIPELQTLSPQNVFLCYGLNDVSIGYWNSEEEYVTEYREVLTKLQEALPNTDFYVNSILPAQPVAFSLASAWENIPSYSHAVRDMCQQEGIAWVECDDLAEANTALYDEDGIHVQKEFYPMWAAQMMTAVYDRAMNSTEAAE